MSISSAIRTAGPFIGNGTAAAFAFAFKVFSSADLLAVEADADTGVETVLTLDSDYSVTLNGDQDNNPGGTLTLLAGPLATGLTLVITTAIAALQATAVTNQGGFYPDVFNGSLDLLTVLVQQVLEAQARSITLPVTDTGSSAALPPATARAGKMLGFDVAGNLTLLPTAPGSGVPAVQAASGVVDGANKDFSFAASPDVTPVPLVIVGGVVQDPTTDYGPPVLVSGGTWKVTFTAAPALVDPANPPKVRILLFA